MRWRTIAGDRRSYVGRIVARLAPGTVRSGSPVVSVTPRAAGASSSRPATGRTSGSTPSSWRPTRTTRCALLRDADLRERAALGAFEYSANEVVLHTDERLLPGRERARASWNVETADCRRPAERLTMTYHMNRLQALPGETPYLRLGQPGGRVRPEHVIVDAEMRHPRYTFGTLRGQEAIGAIQGHRDDVLRRCPPRATGSTKTDAGPASRRRDVLERWRRVARGAGAA